MMIPPKNYVIDLLPLKETLHACKYMHYEKIYVPECKITP